MREGYLQRLLDHGAAHHPPAQQIVPSGVSTSPLAIADQRLNDPGFADDFSFVPTGLAGDDAQPMPTTHRARPVKQRLPQVEPTTASVTSEPTVSVVEPIEAGIDSALPPSVYANPSPDFMIPPVGNVYESDFVPPDPEWGASEERPVKETSLHADPSEMDQSTQRIASAPPPRKPIAAVDETAPAQAPPTADTPSDPVETVMTLATNSPPEVIQTVPPPQRSEVQTGEENWTIPEPAKPTREPLLSEPAFAHPTLTEAPEPHSTAYTPPMAPEPLRTVDAPAAPAPQASATTPAAPTKERDVTSESKTALPRQQRPMTASGASVIGPIQRRPRAVTLFGLRRR